MYRKAAETILIGLIFFWALLNAFESGLCLGLFVGAVLLTATVCIWRNSVETGDHHATITT